MNASQLIAAFQALTTEQKHEFFKAVAADKSFPPAVRYVAEKAKPLSELLTKNE